jgi:hypothetical protein
MNHLKRTYEIIEDYRMAINTLLDDMKADLTLEHNRMPLIDEVYIEVTIAEEWDHPSGYFASGDDEADAEMVRDILEDLGSNPWAWCMVTVTANWGEFKGSATLGGCSYKSRGDFITNSGYYEDMKEDAYNNLLVDVEDK